MLVRSLNATLVKKLLVSGGVYLKTPVKPLYDIAPAPLAGFGVPTLRSVSEIPPPPPPCCCTVVNAKLPEPSVVRTWPAEPSTMPKSVRSDGITGGVYLNTPSVLS